MRIVHVVLSLHVGGQERLILNLSRALVQHGHDVTVVSLTAGGALRPSFGDIPIVDVVRADGLDASLFPRLALAFRRLRPDVVHTHNPGPLLFGAPAARVALVRRVVHTKHGANNLYNWRSLFAARVAMRALNAFVAVSEDTAAIARAKEQVPARLLRVIPNGIPLAEFRRDAAARARVRAELGIPDGAVVVGTVGRLVPEKDYPLLVRAAAPLLGDGVRLVFVGDGPSRGDIERAIPHEMRRFVTLTGVRHDVPALFSSFDLFTLSSATEGLPLVVPEAMAASLPVVATAVGALPDIVPADVGLLAPHGDVDALRSAIAALVSDPARRTRMGDAARRHADLRFSLDRMARQYEDLYAGKPATT